MGAENGNVAIDGFVASGKSTVGRALARRLRYLYLDTGAMYRSVALLALRNGVAVDQESALVDMLEAHKVAVETRNRTQLGYVVVIDGKDATERLFDPDVTAAVSAVAALPAIRAALVEFEAAPSRAFVE